MARKYLNVVEGTGETPKTFIDLFCAKEHKVTPHWAGKIEQEGGELRIQMRCRKCGTTSLYVTDELPAGYAVYDVTITGEDGPHLPEQLRPVPYLEEKLQVIGTSEQDAHQRAQFAHSLKFGGQLMKIYINGELHLDERY